MLDRKENWRTVVKFCLAPIESIQRKNSDLSVDLHAAGQRAGRPVHMEPMRGSRGGPSILAYRNVHMTVGLRVESPVFCVWRRARSDNWGRSPDRYEMDVGDEAFDSQVGIESPNPEAIRQWMTEDRKSALLALFEAYPSAIVTRERVRVVIVDSRNPLTSKPVTDALDGVLEIAERFDTSPGG